MNKPAFGALGIFNDMLAVFWWWPWGCSAENESAWNLQLKASHCCPLWRFHKKMLVKEIEVNRAAALGPAAAGAPGPMGSGLPCPPVRRGEWLSALLRAGAPIHDWASSGLEPTSKHNKRPSPSIDFPTSRLLNNQSSTPIRILFFRRFHAIFFKSVSHLTRTRDPRHGTW